MTHLNNLLWSDFIECYLTLPWTDSRNTGHSKPALSQARKEKKKYIRREAASWIFRVSSPSHLSCSTFTTPSTTPPVTHYRRHGEGHGHEDTVYETEVSEWKLNLREERKKVKKEEKQPVKPSPPLLHLICSVQLPPLDHSISYTLSETQSGTRISVKQFTR